MVLTTILDQVIVNVLKYGWTYMKQNTSHQKRKQCRHGELLYNPHDQYIGRSLDLYGEYSQGEIDLFSEFVEVGSTIVDVGAHIGTHTVFFASAAGFTGRVYAFEPQRYLYLILLENIAVRMRAKRSSEKARAMRAERASSR